MKSEELTNDLSGKPKIEQKQIGCELHKILNPACTDCWLAYYKSKDEQKQK